MSELVNTAALFAAPRLYAKVPDLPRLRHALAAAIERFLVAVDPFSPADVGMANLFRLAAAARLLKETLAAGQEAHALSPEVMTQARACIEAIGVPAPPEGWDAFEGWPET